MTPTCHTGGTHGGGGLPPLDMSVQKLYSCFCPCCLSPYTLLLVIPVVLPQLKMIYNTSDALHLGAGSPKAFSLLSVLHTGFDYALPETPPPFHHHSMDNVVLPSILHGTLVLPPSSAVGTLSLTESLMPDRVGRSSELSSWSFFRVPLCQTSQSECRTLPAARPGPLMQPGHHPHRKR